MSEIHANDDASPAVRLISRVLRPGLLGRAVEYSLNSQGEAQMLTPADIEAEYVEALATITPKQLWAVQIYGTACALVAAERGSTLAGTPEEQRVAREMIFKAEAARRNAEN
jgi:hypothetical protein